MLHITTIMCVTMIWYDEEDGFTGSLDHVKPLSKPYLLVMLLYLHTYTLLHTTVYLQWSVCTIEEVNKRDSHNINFNTSKADIDT